MTRSNEPEGPGSTKSGRRSSSKSQHRPVAATLSPPSLLSPPKTSISSGSVSTSPQSLGQGPSPGTGRGVGSRPQGLRRQPSVASIRQAQPTVATSAPEVSVSMVYGEREPGAALGSAEKLLAVELASASSPASSSSSASASGSGVRDASPVERMDSPPAMTPSTSPSTSSVRAPQRSSTGWFSSLSRNRGRQASTSVSILQEQQRRASKLTSPSALSLSPQPQRMKASETSSSTEPASTTSPVRQGKEREATTGDHDHPDLPPMLTITDSFPIPMHESPSEDAPPHSTLKALQPGPPSEHSRKDVNGRLHEVFVAKEEGESKNSETEATVLGGADGLVVAALGGVDGMVAAAFSTATPQAQSSSSTTQPIPISGLSTSQTPTTTITPSTPPKPTPTSSAAAPTPSSPPECTSLSTTPRKRSWFFSPSSPAKSPQAKATPAAAVPIPPPMHLATSPLSPHITPTLEEAVVHPPLPTAGSSQPAEDPSSRTLQWEGLGSTISTPRPIPQRADSGISIGGGVGAPSSLPSSIDDFVPSLPVTPPVVGYSAHQAQENKGEEVVDATSTAMGTVAQSPLAPTSRFMLSIPLLGRAKIPLGVALGGGEKKDRPEPSKKGDPSKDIVAAPSPGLALGDPQANVGSDKGAPSAAPGATSNSSSHDTSASASTASTTTEPVSLAEPVHAQEAHAAGDNPSSQHASASGARPGDVEGVNTEGDIPVEDQGLDHSAGNPSSSPSKPTSAEQQEAYHSWWNYVGWGSTTSVNEGGSNGPVRSGDISRQPGKGGSGVAAANEGTTTEEPGSVKDTGVGSALGSAETGREKVEVTLATTTTTMTKISPSAPVTEANANTNGSDINRGNGKGFDAETSEDVVEGDAAGVTPVRGRGKEGDGELVVVRGSEDVGQGVMNGEGDKLDGTDSVALGSGATSGPGAGVASGEASEKERAGSSWLSPWAWYGAPTSTTVTVPTTNSESQVSPDAPSMPEASKEGEERRDGVAVAQGDEEAKEQKVDIAQKPDDISPDSKVDEALEPGITTPERTLELPNPIEESIKANHTGWASFFSKQSLLVKAIGYGETTEPAKTIKRDEHGVEVMDLDSEDEDESDHGSKKDDESSNGGESRSRSLVPKLLTYPVEKLVATASTSRQASPNPSGRSPKEGDPPAEPLTGDEDIKRKVACVPISKAASKGSSSGSTASAPPSPSGSVPPLSSKQPQPTLAEKSKSAPVTPKRTASPSPSVTKKNSTSSSPPNLVLPTWADTFHTPPRSIVLRPPSPPISPPTTPGPVQDAGVGTRLLGKTMKFVSNVLWAKEGGQHEGGEKHDQAGQSVADGNSRHNKGKRHFNAPHPLRRSSSGGGYDIASLLEQERKVRFERYGQELPKSWDVLEGALEDGATAHHAPLSRLASSLSWSASGNDLLGHVSAEDASRGISKDVLRGCRRVVIIGVHGWFPGAVMRTVLGEPTGTSSKFANMMEQAVQEFEGEHEVELEKITKIPLEGEGTIERRVEKLYNSLIANDEWMDDLREADVIFVATHSQGSVVSTHLMSKLIEEGIIYTRHEQLLPAGGDTIPSAVGLPRTPERKLQRVCCLALCGIHLGPLRYLRSSSLVAPYIQYFENAAARELFEFQNTDSAVSKAYVKALENVLDHGIKMVYVASLNDQVVPIYSGIFTAATHPLILRALYIDGDAYHSSDFLSNLLVLLLKLRNSGITDGGLLAHLSEATAGSLSGVGHSTAYEELATYSLAVRYLFMTNNGSEKHPSLVIEDFDAAHEQNDYEIPWSLRDVIADERVIHFFSNEVAKLRDAFRDWHPKTTILRDLKRKLQPIQRLPPSFSSGSYSTSKL